MDLRGVPLKMPEEIISQSHGLPRKSVLHLLGTWELGNLICAKSVLSTLLRCVPQHSRHFSGWG